MGWGGKGKGGLMDLLGSLLGGGGGGWGRSKGKRAGRKFTDSRDDDPEGSVRVLVMGFDFGTTDEQFEGHMGQAGEIHAVHWINKGKAVVVYKEEASAAKAKELDQSTIEGNSRYLSVIIPGDKKGG